MSAEKQGSHTTLYRVLMTAMLVLVSFSAQAGGFDGRFTARTGDLNSDGRTDVYLKWSPRIIPISLDDISIPIPMTRRQIPDFVLQQTASGTFTIVSSLSGAQLGALSSWPRATGVELVPGDVNYDGTLDLIVRKLTTAISGVDANQVIIASPTADAAPVDVKALTSDMKSFYKQVTQWYMSPEITETLYALVWSYYGYLNYYDPIFCASFVACQIRFDDVDDPSGNWPSDDPFSPNVYHYFGASLVPYATQTYHDYSITDPTAYQFASAFYPMDPSGEITPGAAGTVSMQNILTTLWAGQQHVNLTRQPTGDVESGVKDEWNWVKVLEHLSRIYYEVCIADGREAVNCFRDIVNPGGNAPAICTNIGSMRPPSLPTPTWSYAITPIQRAMDTGHQRRQFWVSREQDSCDPFAPAALGVVDEKGLGRVTMQWLRTVAQHKGVAIDEQQIGYAIVHGHVLKTDEDFTSIPKLLSPQQITDYHVQVFQSFGLPAYTFGGAPFGTDGLPGRIWQDVSGLLVWCPGCDIAP